MLTRSEIDYDAIVKSRTQGQYCSCGGKPIIDNATLAFSGILAGQISYDALRNRILNALNLDIHNKLRNNVRAVYFINSVF